MTITKIWLRRRKKVLGHERSSTGLLDENRNSCCTWNWLILYGNNVCHSTVHWLSIDSVNLFFFFLVFKKYVEIRRRANGLWTSIRVSRSWNCSIFNISRVWEKYHQQCKMMNVHLIHLRHYLYERSRAFPVCNLQIMY